MRGALQDPEIRLWNGAGSTSPEDVRSLLERRRDWSAGDHASFAVVAVDGHEPLGSISLHSIDPEQADAEIGYWTVGEVDSGGRRGGRPDDEHAGDARAGSGAARRQALPTTAATPPLRRGPLARSRARA